MGSWFRDPRLAAPLAHRLGIFLVTGGDGGRQDGGIEGRGFHARFALGPVLAGATIGAFRLALVAGLVLALRLASRLALVTGEGIVVRLAGPFVYLKNQFVK